MSKVTVGLGLTKNLGNFENVRIDIQVEAETLPGESSAAAIDRVYKLVESKVNEKLDEALSDDKE